MRREQVAAEGLLQGDAAGALACALSSGGAAEAGLGAPGQPQYRMPDVSVSAAPGGAHASAMHGRVQSQVLRTRESRLTVLSLRRRWTRA